MRSIDGGLKNTMRTIAKEAALKGVISGPELEALLTRPTNRATLEWANELVSKNRVMLRQHPGAVAAGTEIETTGDFTKWAIASKLEDAICLVTNAEMHAHMAEWKRAQGFG